MKNLNEIMMNKIHNIFLLDQHWVSRKYSIFFSGLTLFRGVKALDRDKPNTPNSDIQYALVAGNQDGKFALDNSHLAHLTLKKPLDFDTGDREFILTVSASVRIS